MPQAVAAIAVTVGNWAATAALAATSATVGTGTAIAVAATAAYAGQALVYIGTALAIGALTAPNVPSPEAGKSPLRQAVNARRRGYGRARMSGPYMLFEAQANYSYDVFALHDGKIDGFELYYLNDDLVTLDGSGWVNTLSGSRYGPEHVMILTRVGEPTETSYAAITAALPTYWTDDHRGDGVASMAMICNHGEQKYFLEDFPNGLPMPSAVMRLQLVYDPRDGAQNPLDPNTWLWSDNPALATLHFLMTDRGYDWATRFAPTVSTWIAAANICEEQIPLKAGGTEDRYRLGGFYTKDTDPTAVLREMLSSFDGWLATRGDGAFVVRTGKYAAPTVTLTDDHILDYSFQRYVADEESTNELAITFTSPEHDYTEVGTDAWRDETDIITRGLVRSTSLPLRWVQSNAQARRLAKRAMSRLSAPIRGSIHTNLYGLSVLGERYLRLQISEIGVLNNIVVEVQEGVEIDLVNAGVTIPWVVADPAVDSWNAATEEGDGVPLTERIPDEALEAPTITSLTPFEEDTGFGTTGTRISVELPDSGRPDLSYALRWRIEGGVAWTESSASDIVPGGVVTLETGYVAVGVTIEVQAATVSGGGSQSPWSEPPSTVDT